MKVNYFLSTAFLILSVFILQTGFAQQAAVLNTKKITKRIAGDPLEHLPENIELLTKFGERPDISPDNNRVAFMAKGFGDAMVMDLKTRKLDCLTCNIPAATFLKVMHLPTGDYILIGPERFEDPVTSKKNTDLWFLSKEAGSKPVKLGVKVSEGIAVSKKSMKIAFTKHLPHATEKSTQIITAEVDLASGVPRLMNEKVALENTDPVCTLEAQDFYDNDSRLTFFCYISNGAFDVKGVELSTQKVTNFTNVPGAFNEPEGIFPEGYTTVEADRQCEWLGGNRGSANLDIWKLKLDGTGKDFVRLTHFNDFEGGKAANPVVATNGKFMAFQAARSSDPPGVGHGVLLYWFPK